MIDTLITALSNELELSAEEIADTIWLALQIQESQSESTTTPKKNALSPPLRSEELEGETLAETKTKTSDSGKTASKQLPEEQKAGIYPRNQQETLFKSELSFKVPDTPSLRKPLTLARALKPLMRRIPSGTTLVLDEAATTQRIANEGLWLPVLRPTLEPWLDLELVVDEGISMQIWRHTIRELERLLKNYGIFRDVRVWGLITDNLEQVQIRRGIGATAKNQSPRSPAELIDPSGRRLVLVVSDCVSSLWRDGKVTITLEIWAKQGSMAIVQMLPKWLWKRTALGRSSEVRLQGLNPGEFNQKLIAKEVSLWDELEETRGVKVPVFTLEPDKVATWAQMLSGKGSIWTSGYVFKLDPLPVNKERKLFNLDYGQLSAEQRVQAFRVTASPMARKLAGLLAAAPAISLPIVRLIQKTLLKESQQVHVAEVFLGGLLKPLSEINAETNPDRVQYEFMDGVRELLVDSVPSGYVLNVVDEVSKYVANNLGLSLEDFAAVLRNPQQVRDSDITGDVGYFATVTAQILRRLGGEYNKFADSLENNITVDNFPTKFEPNRHFIGQEGNTTIYSICTDKPWYLPFDALVIPSGPKIGLKGSFAQSFQIFMGEKKFSIICDLINQAMEGNKQSAITPESPLLVSLPSQIKSQFLQLDSSQSNKFLIFATVESLEPNIAGAFKATEAIIIKIVERGIPRIVLPLLGTGNNNLPINEVAIAMLSAITQTLNNFSSNSLQEIILVERTESSVEIINQVAQSLLLAQQGTYKVKLLSEAGTDYTQLRDLLEAGKWREADEETARVILQASGHKERDWLDEEDMKALPSRDLQTIDQLWSKYSNGRFGFSVQKRIWLGVGGQPGYYDEEIYNKFGETVGWYIKDEGNWLLWKEHTFGLNAPQGHLPRYLPSQQKRIRHYLFYRNDLQVNSNQFQSLIQDKIEGFVGREYVFEAIQTFIQENKKGYFTIIGDPGQGKSAILAKYVQDTECIAHFNVQLQGPNRADQFLESVCKQLIARYELPYDPLPSNATQDGGFLGRLLFEVTKRSKGQPVIIAVDALDEVDSSGSYRDANILYLPPHLPDGVYFIMTRRRGVEVPLITYAPNQIISLLDYQIDSQRDVRLYIQNRVNDSEDLWQQIDERLHIHNRVDDSENLSQQIDEHPYTQNRVDDSENLSQQIDEREEKINIFADKIAHKSENNFMYLRYVLLDIEKGLYKDLSLERFPQGLHGYYDFHWRRMGMTANPLPDAKIKILYILGEVKQPVSRQQICDFSGEDTRTVETVLNEWKQFLHEVIVNTARFYRIYNDSFRDFLHHKDILKTTKLTFPEGNLLIAHQLTKFKNPRSE